MKRKILAQFLALGLALTSFPVSAYAAETTEDVTVETEVAEANGEGTEVAEVAPEETDTDSSKTEEKEFVKKVDEQIRSIVDNVIVPTIQKHFPEAKDVLPTVVKQLQIIQQNVLKFLFGRW